MGGSLGLALAGKCGRRVGIARDEHHALRAVEVGAVDEVTDVSVALPSADIVVLALPVADIAWWVAHAAIRMKPGAILTDVGSTKATIVAEMDAIRDDVRAVGGHPMCGREVSGIEHATRGLFDGARYVLTPTARSDEQALATMRELVSAVGARPVELDAQRHDDLVAFASHLPYVTAVSLVRALAGLGDDDDSRLAFELAAGGFRDATRTAAGDPAMWRDILRTNDRAIRTAMRALEQGLAELRAATDDPARLEELLSQAAVQRRGMFGGT